MRLVLFADPHLSDIECTAQEQAAAWAFAVARELQPDAAACLGDISACGSPEAAVRFLNYGQTLPCPLITMPGNSDIRTPETAPLMERLLSDYQGGWSCENLSVVTLNTAQGSLSAAEQKRLTGLALKPNVIILSHHGPEYLDAEALRFISAFIKQQNNVLLWVFGHIHEYRQARFEGVPTLSLRALDPDKCTGGAPMLLVCDIDGADVTPDIREYTQHLPNNWTEAEKREFIAQLGISCYHPEADLHFAIENDVKNLELRQPPGDELPLISRWRTATGGTLSLHLSGVKPSEQAFARLSEYAACALALNANAVTLHPPQILNSLLLPSDETLLEQLADRTAEILRPLAAAGIDILFENNHTPYGASGALLQRDFGCAPAEVTLWKCMLEERLGRRYGYRFDIGHARNNMPLSRDYPIGKWLALIGPEIHGYHIHQTQLGEGSRMTNHHPITGLHDGFVAFDGFLTAWHTGSIRHAPLILEIREGEGAPATYMRLKRLIAAK